MVKHVCLHFVGFKGDEYWSALRVWGEPDFYHPQWDCRARLEAASQDVVVHAQGSWDREPKAQNAADTLSCSQLSQHC
jgi:hypothetical protein